MFAGDEYAYKEWEEPDWWEQILRFLRKCKPIAMVALTLAGGSLFLLFCEQLTVYLFGVPSFMLW